MSWHTGVSKSTQIEIRKNALEVLDKLDIELTEQELMMFEIFLDHQQLKWYKIYSEAMSVGTKAVRENTVFSLIDKNLLHDDNGNGYIGLKHHVLDVHFELMRPVLSEMMEMVYDLMH
jgi:hypothetical protein